MYLLGESSSRAQDSCSHSPPPCSWSWSCSSKRGFESLTTLSLSTNRRNPTHPPTHHGKRKLFSTPLESEKTDRQTDFISHYGYGGVGWLVPCLPPLFLFFIFRWGKHNFWRLSVWLMLRIPPIRLNTSPYIRLTHHYTSWLFVSKSLTFTPQIDPFPFCTLDFLCALLSSYNNNPLFRCFFLSVYTCTNQKLMTSFSFFWIGFWLESVTWNPRSR